jgi:hypothetical protein
MTPLADAFVQLANEFLAEHPAIAHEWRRVESYTYGTRLDLVCAPGSAREVFARLFGTQIAVGATSHDHVDFEDFGRGLSDALLAAEAFACFRDLLVENGHVELRADFEPNSAAPDKEPSLLAFLDCARHELGRGTFDIVDHWTADLCATGLAAPSDHRRLAYVSTYHLPPGRVNVHLEIPSSTDTPLPDEVHLNITFTEATALIASHLAK